MEPIFTWMSTLRASFIPLQSHMTQLKKGLFLDLNKKCIQFYFQRRQSLKSNKNIFLTFTTQYGSNCDTLHTFSECYSLRKKKWLFRKKSHYFASNPFLFFSLHCFSSNILSNWEYLMVVVVVKGCHLQGNWLWSWTGHHGSAVPPLHPDVDKLASSVKMVTDPTLNTAYQTSKPQENSL